MSSLPFNLAHSLKVMSDAGLQRWSSQLVQDLPELFKPGRNGNLPRWLKVLQQLPTIATTAINFNSSRIGIGEQADCIGAQRAALELLLLELKPWRKGPFKVFGIDVDAEWRSDWKWDRLINAIEPLADRRVLDVGCGNGYYALRMAGVGAKLVIGVDPSLLVLSQFCALRHFVKNKLPVHILPVGIDDVPSSLRYFDSVFSMGVLYHRRHPAAHLCQLRDALRLGGELILETLVISGEQGEVLLPVDRYAQMRNVWSIPSVSELSSWLHQVGFKEVRCLNVSTTSTVEQRSTRWMQFNSLENFLDTTDSNLTVEGYPAPQRAIFSAISP